MPRTNCRVPRSVLVAAFFVASAAACASGADNAGDPYRATSTASVASMASSTTAGGDATGSGPDCEPADCTLGELGRGAGMLVGAAVAPTQLDEVDTAALIAAEMTSVTPENEMKWAEIHPERERYDFEQADRLVEFAESNGLAVRGHTLVWHQDAGNPLPEWLLDVDDPEEMRTVVADHIATVVGRYRGRIDRWDVVNEPLVSVGAGPVDNHFSRVLGPEWIALAFEEAHAADPEARLFLNEHSAEYSEERADALVALVEELLAADVPLHGVGLQSHLFVGPPPEGAIGDLVRRLRALDLEVAITELDVPLPAGDEPGTTVAPTPDALATQADAYQQVVEECLVAGCNEVTTWGVSDRATWLDTFLGRPDTLPLLFDAALQPKPAYEEVRAVLTDATG